MNKTSLFGKRSQTPKHGFSEGRENRREWREALRKIKSTFPAPGGPHSRNLSATADRNAAAMVTRRDHSAAPCEENFFISAKTVPPGIEPTLLVHPDAAWLTIKRPGCERDYRDIPDAGVAARYH